MGPLATLFSNIDRAKRYVGGLVSDPVGRIEQSIGQAGDDLKQLGLLASQAYADPKDPFKVTDQQAWKKLTDTYLSSVMNFAPVGMTNAAKSVDVFRPPQADALETARKNAVTMLGLPPNNTAMDRAKALGFDTEAYHSTGADFRSFQINPYRGAVSVAATPSGAVSGAKAGHADMTGTGANSVMPLLMRSEGVQGLRLPANQERFLASLPQVASETQVDELMKSAPKGSFWGNFFNEVENADGTFSYVRKDPPKVSFQDVQKTKRGADGSALPNWGDERWSANRQKDIGGKGWLQADEAGISASIVDPSILRSRFAAFDPARVNENDLLGRADLGFLGLLAGGSAGATYLMRDQEK